MKHRAIEENLINPKKYVMLGIRGSLYDPDDMKWAKEQVVDTIEEDLNDLRSEINEIKSLLKELVHGN